MSKRLITMLLFISLAFNLAVLGSIIWLRLHIPRTVHRERSRNEWVRLPEHIHHDQNDPEIRQMRVEYDNQKVNLMRSLAGDNYVEKDIIAIIDSSLTAQTNLEKELGHRLLDIRKQMSSEEAEKYFGARADMLQRRINRYRDIRNRRLEDEKNIDNRTYPHDGRRRPLRPESQ
ncbi:MAG: hypothetical protein WCY87_01365 [Candidatus Cloacimonadales bacterium]|mgnify:CR=1 FL=1|nr:hypothetical protein [Candidatus Cloacimonadota bacterium]MDY0380716.1 hypothetical protein [Candidatus Cloacimonadaceae bacterium]HCM14915.1 hypothetical protein [Candidatus Cloacimonas sp.]MCB5256792.1 hypothetical protein [Candidatus Cloacimonadota bacterium]MCB5264505.1 hypothetical protein [Candidatus Cloacimonadota bacterium]